MRNSLESFWRDHYEREEQPKRVFKLLSALGRDYLVNEDFASLMRILLETHPGLEFL